MGYPMIENQGVTEFLAYSIELDRAYPEVLLVMSKTVDLNV